MEISNFEVSSPPADGISSVQFSPENEGMLLASSWDRTVRLYSIDHSSSTQLAWFEHPAATLTSCFWGSSTCLSGGLDTVVRLIDFPSQSMRVLGQHEAPVRCAVRNQELGTLQTGGWDRCVKHWDPRREGPIMVQQLPERVYAMDVKQNTLIITTADRHVLVYDARQLSRPLQQHMSCLKRQTRAVALTHDTQQYVISSIEGRIGVHSLAQQTEFAFKCHRQRSGNNDVETLHAVNTLSFNPLYGSLVSGGSDGEINVWDLEHRRRLFTKNCRAPVSCVAWTRSGMRMVVGTSWNMQQTNQDNDHKLRVDAIHVCNMQQEHVDPRLVKLVAD